MVIYPNNMAVMLATHHMLKDTENIFLNHAKQIWKWGTKRSFVMQDSFLLIHGIMNFLLISNNHHSTALVFKK